MAAPPRHRLRSLASLPVDGSRRTVVAAPAAEAARSPRITFYFGLERPEAAARKAFAAASQPGSAGYRRFLGARQIAQRYGARPRTRTRLRRVARRHRLVARVDRSGVFARVSGPVKRFERVFRVRIRREFDNDVILPTAGSCAAIAGCGFRAACGLW